MRSIVPASPTLAAVLLVIVACGGKTAPVTFTAPCTDSTQGTSLAFAGGAPDPSSPSLVGWFDAAKGLVIGSNGMVQVWKDQSRYANDLSDPIEGKVPFAGPIEGKPALAFSLGELSNGWVGTTSAFPIGTGDFLVAMVARGEPFLFCEGLEDGTGEFDIGNSFQWVVDMSGPPDWGSDSVAMAPLGDAPHVVAARRVGKCFEGRVDGAASGSTDGPYVTADLGMMSCRVTGGDIAEILVVARPTGADVTAIEAYLRHKYDIP